MIHSFASTLVGRPGSHGRRWVAAAALFAATGLSAQAPSATRRGAVKGVVTDSLTDAGLDEAEVQLAAADERGSTLVVRTDSLGAFAIANVPAGRYLIGFDHPLLISLGLEMAPRPITVVEGEATDVQLSIPSSRTVRALRCGATVDDGLGMLVGALRTAAGESPVPTATVEANWPSLVQEGARFSMTRERVAATVGADGSYLLCGVPSGASIELSVTAPRFHPVMGLVEPVPVTGVGVLDFRLADSARATGTASIDGQVSLGDRAMAAQGRAQIAALRRDVPVESGRFRIEELPAGTWVVVVKVVGGTSRAVVVQGEEGSVARAQVSVPPNSQQLTPVRVIGTRDRDSQILDDVLRRKRLGVGTVFLPDDPALKSATFTTDVMALARGFSYQSSTEILGRPRSTGGRCTRVAVYLDDVLLSEGWQALDAFARPSEVLAIETFPDILFAPVRYRFAKKVNEPDLAGLPWARKNKERTYCALVLVWTRSRPVSRP